MNVNVTITVSAARLHALQALLAGFEFGSAESAPALPAQALKAAVKELEKGLKAEKPAAKAAPKVEEVEAEEEAEEVKPAQKPAKAEKPAHKAAKAEKPAPKAAVEVEEEEEEAEEEEVTVKAKGRPVTKVTCTVTQKKGRTTFTLDGGNAARRKAAMAKVEAALRSWSEEPEVVGDAVVLGNVDYEVSDLQPIVDKICSSV